ncbi:MULTISPECIES: HAMP domain-containing sensor histidine kinase [unclassified Bradyrhizobium]|uniref:sensor histidine kinase n=1 Tax=unclassified Bradyrhizobium TaxID=2631580 RepID=UPI0028EF5594|nr:MULTISPECIES: HAMP domain-containing sensor histidine kinase [unclassified Bradyrhizobium]
MLRLLERLGLRFEDAVDERRFVDHFVHGNIAWTQIAMLLGAFTFAGYTLWDFVLYPEIVPTTLKIRGGTALFVLLPLTALLSTPARKWAEPIQLVFCVIPGCVLPTIYWVLPSGFTYSAAGMIIVILFVSTMLPLRIGAHAVFCLASWGALAIAESLAAEPLPPGLRFIDHSLVGNACLLSLYAVGAREVQARKQFRTAEALQREKERSEASLRDLHATQAHLVQAEKLASLGQLVAGVGHEVSTPLGLALTTSTAMEDDVEAIAQMLGGGPVRRSDLARGVARLQQGLNLTTQSLHRASEMVHSFKQVAVDQANETRQTFELQSWLADHIAKLRPLLARQGLTVALSCPEGVVLTSYPGALGQVISILAFNAATHAYPGDTSGVFTVAVAQPLDRSVCITCADKGVGMPDHVRGRVFDPFFTTRREKGNAGLGLHIAFNLVVSTLGGRIELDSDVQQGTRIALEIPLVGPNKPAELELAAAH